MCFKLQEEGLHLIHSVSLLPDMSDFQKARLPVQWGVVTNKREMCKSFGLKEKYVAGR